MANVSRFWFMRHLRAEPNQFILHYKDGKVVRSGPGIAYWFNPLSAAVAQVPVEDNETTFVLNERASDFQEVSVQCTVTFRVVDHARAAGRVNFAISLENGAWLERPLERLANLWSQKALEPVRSYVASVPVIDAVRSGAERIRASLDESLRKDAEITAIGLELVTVQVTRVASTAELEKALQTPTREALQQKADEAMFSRRALAVEKERAIKENELATEVELARRQAQLIEQKGANQKLDIQQAAANERTRVEAELERQALVARAEAARLEGLAKAEAERNRIVAEAHARDWLKRAAGESDARKLWDATEIEKEAARIAMWKETPQRVAAAFAMQTAASKLDKVNHLNVTPDLLRNVLEELATDRAGKCARGLSKRVSRIVVVTRKTPLELLIERYGTYGQAKFYLSTRGQDIAAQEDIHRRLEAGLSAVMASLPSDQRFVRVDRDALDRFLFAPDDVVLIVGQDGLVPNVAKYLSGQLTIGVNPDPARYDGVLCRFPPSSMADLLGFAAAPTPQFAIREVTMARALREDGQVLLSLNEIFVGHRTHQSARYRITSKGTTERHSSSGLICATGTGCTGWARSITEQRALTAPMPKPDEPRLAWFVREPFPSVATGTALNFGYVEPEADLVITSEMGEGGTIFADGIESDHIDFLDGQTVRIGIASSRLRLVGPP